MKKPKKALKLLQGTNLQCQDQDADGNDIFIPTKPVKMSRGSDLSREILSPCFYKPDSFLPTITWKDKAKPLVELKQKGALIKLDYSKNRELTKNRNFKATLNISFSLKEEIPAMMNVFYGDQPKNPRAESNNKPTFPVKNKPFDDLINDSKFFNKYFAGNITFFANEPGTGHVHHHYNSHDELTNPHRNARQTGQVSFDITSLIKRQKNDPNVNDQIFFNLDPTQKYASELAEGFKIKEISIEHFTIPDEPPRPPTALSSIKKPSAGESLMCECDGKDSEGPSEVGP